MIWYGKKRETESFTSCGRRHIGRGEIDEDLAKVSGFLAAKGHSEVWTWTSSVAQVWVHSSDAAKVSVDVGGS